MNRLNRSLTYPRQISILTWFPQLQFLFFLLGQTGQNAVENVVVPLVGALIHDPRLLQQVLLNLGSLDNSLTIEMNVYVLPKSG